MSPAVFLLCYWWLGAIGARLGASHTDPAVSNAPADIVDSVSVCLKNGRQNLKERLYTRFLSASRRDQRSICSYGHGTAAGSCVGDACGADPVQTEPRVAGEPVGAGNPKGGPPGGWQIGARITLAPSTSKSRTARTS